MYHIAFVRYTIPTAGTLDAEISRRAEEMGGSFFGAAFYGNGKALTMRDLDYFFPSTPEALAFLDELKAQYRSAIVHTEVQVFENWQLDEDQGPRQSLPVDDPGEEH